MGRDNYSFKKRKRELAKKKKKEEKIQRKLDRKNTQLTEGSIPSPNEPGVVGPSGPLPETPFPNS